MKKLGVVSVALTTLFASETAFAFEKGDKLVKGGLAIATSSHTLA